MGAAPSTEAGQTVGEHGGTGLAPALELRWAGVGGAGSPAGSSRTILFIVLSRILRLPYKILRVSRPEMSLESLFQHIIFTEHQAEESRRVMREGGWACPWGPFGVWSWVFVLGGHLAFGAGCLHQGLEEKERLSGVCNLEGNLTRQLLLRWRLQKGECE